MPLYEYLCVPCNGVFEELRPIRESDLPMPCPECFKDAERIMPTSFSAFTFREGYPRRIPDDGTYYHLGKTVTTRVSRGRPNEHPEINKPKPKPTKLKGEKSAMRDMREAARKHELVDASGNEVKPGDVSKGVDSGRIYRKGTPRRVTETRSPRKS